MVVAGVKIKEAAQVLQAVAAQAGKGSLGQPQGIEDGRTAPGKSLSLNDWREEAEVKRRVVQHQRRAGCEFDQAADDLFGARCAAHHIAADAVNGSHSAGDDAVRVDQGLKGPALAAGQHFERGDLNDAAERRAEAGRLDVERGEARFVKRPQRNSGRRFKVQPLLAGVRLSAVIQLSPIDEIVIHSHSSPRSADDFS